MSKEFTENASTNLRMKYQVDDPNEYLIGFEHEYSTQMLN